MAANDEGVKFDDEKSRIDLIPPEVILAMGTVLGYGAKKYSERNWEKGFNWGRSVAALQRHLMMWSMGEDIDPESGLPHLHHVATNAAFLVAFEARKAGTDDRSPYIKMGVAAPLASKAPDTATPVSPSATPVSPPVAAQAAPSAPKPAAPSPISPIGTEVKK